MLQPEGEPTQNYALRVCAELSRALRTMQDAGKIDSFTLDSAGSTFILLRLAFLGETKFYELRIPMPERAAGPVSMPNRPVESSAVVASCTMDEALTLFAESGGDKNELTATGSVVDVLLATIQAWRRRTRETEAYLPAAGRVQTLLNSAISAILKSDHVSLHIKGDVQRLLNRLRDEAVAEAVADESAERLRACQEQRPPRDVLCQACIGTRCAHMQLRHDGH